MSASAGSQEASGYRARRTRVCSEASAPVAQELAGIPAGSVVVSRAAQSRERRRPAMRGQTATAADSAMPGMGTCASSAQMAAEKPRSARLAQIHSGPSEPRSCANCGAASLSAGGPVPHLRERGSYLWTDCAGSFDSSAARRREPCRRAGVGCRGAKTRDRTCIGTGARRCVCECVARGAPSERSTFCSRRSRYTGRACSRALPCTDVPPEPVGTASGASAGGRKLLESPRYRARSLPRGMNQKCVPMGTEMLRCLVGPRQRVQKPVEPVGKVKIQTLSRIGQVETDSQIR